jgi:uncharacterized repeat protein (TIGR01451 family)
VPEPAWPSVEPVQGQGFPVPVVALHVRVPATTGAGQELRYQLSVENTSRAAAHHVLVRNPLPAHAKYVRANPEPSAREPEFLWQLGTLEGGAHREITLILEPTGAGDIQNCARVQFEHGQCTTTRIGRPGLRLSKQGPTQAILNDSLSYQLTVENTGSADAASVVLTDTLPVGLEHASGKNPLQWELGTLAAGQVRTVEYQVIAKVEGKLCNRAAVTAAGGVREERENCVTVGRAMLKVAKTGPPQRYVNLTAAYEITVTNPGTAPARNVVLTDPLPEQMTFVSASGGGRLVGNEVQWQLGTLAPGASRIVDVVLRARSSGRVRNRAVVAGERGLTDQAEAETVFVGVSALETELRDLDDPVEVGAETRYVITVRNTGSVPATKVRIDALVPEQMQIRDIKAPATHREEGQLIHFEPITLPPGGEAQYQITVQALRSGDVRFKMDLRAEQLTEGPVHEEESTTIYSDLPAGPRPPAGTP